MTYAEDEKKKRMAKAKDELERTAIQYNVEEPVYNRVRRISDAIGRDVIFY